MGVNIERKPIYFIGGVNGVGKSTFLTELVTKHSTGFSVVKASSALMEWLGLGHGDYEGLRALPEDYKNKEFDKMMEALVGRSSHSDQTILVDAHYFHYKNGEMVDTIGEWISMMSALFVINADADDLIKRILEDTKERDLFPVDADLETQGEILDTYLKRTVLKASELSEKYSIPYFVLESQPGNLLPTINKFLELHAEMAK